MFSHAAWCDEAAAGFPWARSGDRRRRGGRVLGRAFGDGSIGVPLTPVGASVDVVLPAMFIHAVNFTFNESATADQIAALCEELRGLEDLVPSLRSAMAGPDVRVAEGNADAGYVAMFDDYAGWKAYQEHPEHIRVALEYLVPILAARHATQFESLD